MSSFEVCEDVEPHPLLEPRCPRYSHVTVRRAYVVWVCCGQKNAFKDVCNYFHYLEAMEEKLPADKRAISRHHEFSLFGNKPPTSTFLDSNFPQLYPQNQFRTLDKQPKPKQEKLKLPLKTEGFNDMTRQNGTTTDEILATSQMIRNHCQTHKITLRQFMEDFKKYAEKCELKHTVNNVAFYINRKMVHDELRLLAECPQSSLNKTNNTASNGEVNEIEPKMNSLDEKYRKNPEVPAAKEIVKTTKRAISKSQETLNLSNNSKPFAVKNNNHNGLKSFKVLKSDGSLSKSISYVDVSRDVKTNDLGFTYNSLNAKFDKNRNIW